MADFDDTTEARLSKSMRPACDRVLCGVFSVTPEQIHRSNPGGYLDARCGIDAKITLHRGLNITVQEKTLGFRYSSYRTFTVEYWQNWKTKEPGEIFHCAAQTWLHGYADETGTQFIEWYLLKVLDLLLWIDKQDADKMESCVMHAGGSKAGFLAIPYDTLPKDVVMAGWRRP